MTAPEDFLLSSYDYELPPDRIATHPAPRRDESRLMVVHPDSVEHRRFRDIAEYLRAGDVLIVNETRVLAARLFGRRHPGGGAVELLLDRPQPGPGTRWSALARPGRKVQPGTRMTFGEDELQAECLEVLPGGERVLRFHHEGDFGAILARLGTVPLPPYITSRRETLGEDALAAEDRERYQTVYARAEGSVAAPTAGLHFTEELMENVRAMGVEIYPVTLHVGPGTFRPIESADVREHPMHEEYALVPPTTAEAATRAKREGRRVICVGTTSMRALESAARELGVVESFADWTRLLIAPGYQFKVADGLITNFHLPHSTLLLLVAAMVGRERLMRLYGEAVKEEYRFYSYGDAMMVAGRKG